MFRVNYYSLHILDLYHVFLLVKPYHQFLGKIYFFSMETEYMEQQDRESAREWANPARLQINSKTVQFIHMKCGNPLQVSLYSRDMYGSDEYDYYLHFKTRCMHCTGHKKYFKQWRKSYICKNIKIQSTYSRKKIFMDRGDHIYGIHGIEKGNDCVFLLDKDGGNFGKLMIHTKSSKQFLKQIQQCKFWNVVRNAFKKELMKIRTRQIYFYWLEQSQKNKLPQMIEQDYNSMQNFL